MSSCKAEKEDEKEDVNQKKSFASLSSLESNSPNNLNPAAAKQPCLRWGLKPLEIIIMLVISVLVLAASYGHWWSVGVVEAWGFVTGGVCVWLVVREHLWNWPIGLANNIFFFILFLRGQLYADMGLQVIYLGLGIYGWWNWVYGGQNRKTLEISRTTRTEWITFAVIIPVCTFGLWKLLIAVNDASPFWDALTTVLSLIAQYLICRKRIENWWFWIAANIIYIPLYFSRQLPLTAVLYLILLGMCFIGIREWVCTLKKGERLP